MASDQVAFRHFPSTTEQARESELHQHGLLLSRETLEFGIELINGLAGTDLTKGRKERRLLLDCRRTLKAATQQGSQPNGIFEASDKNPQQWVQNRHS